MKTTNCSPHALTAEGEPLTSGKIPAASNLTSGTEDVSSAERISTKVGRTAGTLAWTWRMNVRTASWNASPKVEIWRVMEAMNLSAAWGTTRERTLKTTTRVAASRSSVSAAERTSGACSARFSSMSNVCARAAAAARRTYAHLCVMLVMMEGTSGWRNSGSETVQRKRSVIPRRYSLGYARSWMKKLMARISSGRRPFASVLGIVSRYSRTRRLIWCSGQGIAQRMTSMRRSGCGFPFSSAVMICR